MKNTKVRLFIDGLAQPMRMTVKKEQSTHMIVESELAFLKMGRTLELEDAGTKRPAVIDHVEVQVGSENVPQLVVSLKYQDVEEGEIAMNRTHTEEEGLDYDGSEEVVLASPSETTDEDLGAVATTDGHGDEEVILADTSEHSDMDDDVESESEKFKSPLLKKAEELKPMFDGLVRRAKTTAKLLAEKGFSKDKADPSARRVTASAPNGGLHADGRRVVRTASTTNEATINPILSKLPPMTKKNITIGAAVMSVILFGAVAMKKPATPPVDAALAEATKSAELAKADEKVAAEATNVNGAVVFPAQPVGALANNTIPTQPALAQPVQPIGVQPPIDNFGGSGSIAAGTNPAYGPVPTTRGSFEEPAFTDNSSGSFDEPKATKKVTHVVPFGDKGLTHGNVLRLKMDGPIESIQGAPGATGFTVVIPHRRATEPASPLVSHDSRLDTMKVTNESNGAELTVSFNDSVPNYSVRAKGDTLEIVLARARAKEASDHGSVAKAGHSPEKRAHKKTTHKRK